jgi:hypothetical protein
MLLCLDTLENRGCLCNLAWAIRELAMQYRPGTPLPQPAQCYDDVRGLQKRCSANSVRESCIPRCAKRFPTQDQKPAQRGFGETGCLPLPTEKRREWHRRLAAESESRTPRRNYNSQYRSYPDSRKPRLWRPEAAETQQA